MIQWYPRIRTLFRSSLLRILDYRCAGHDHNVEEISQDFEIILPRAGAYQRRDAHGTFLADPNQILFSNMGESYEISHPVDGGDSSTVFLFAPSLLMEIMRTNNPNVEDKTNRLFEHNHITFNSRLQVLQYQLLCAGGQTSYELAIEEEVIRLIAEILYNANHGQSITRKSSRKIIRIHSEQTHAVKAFLNENFRLPLQIEHISAAVHLSPYHLCRIFKQNTGMTIHRYVKCLRLFNAAEHMLEHPASRLDLLALEFGFSNHGHFSTAFRQVFGKNPSELRGRHIQQMSKNLKA